MAEDGPVFVLPVDDDLDLLLREQWTVDPMYRLTLRNAARLARWEPWAETETTRESVASYTTAVLEGFAAGRQVPTVMRWRGALVGSVGARLDHYSGTAEIGYWVDVDHEGEGLVTRSVATLLDHLVGTRGMHRVEARTVVGNARSRRVVERLGFTVEGTLREGMRFADRAEDAVVYGLLDREWRARRSPSGAGGSRG